MPRSMSSRLMPGSSRPRFSTAWTSSSGLLTAGSAAGVRVLILVPADPALRGVAGHPVLVCDRAAVAACRHTGAKSSGILQYARSPPRLGVAAASCGSSGVGRFTGARAGWLRVYRPRGVGTPCSLAARARAPRPQCRSPPSPCWAPRTRRTAGHHAESVAGVVVQPRSVAHHEPGRSRAHRFRLGGPQLLGPSRIGTAAPPQWKQSAAGTGPPRPDSRIEFFVDAATPRPSKDCQLAFSVFLAVGWSGSARVNQKREPPPGLSSTPI